MIKPGESFRMLVTIRKVKDGVPTVIRVNGHDYVLRVGDQFGAGKRKQEGKLHGTDQ